MSDKFSIITADDWKRSIQQSRARPNGVAAQIRAALAKLKLPCTHKSKLTP